VQALDDLGTITRNFALSEFMLRDMNEESAS
jgi:hypothetical protein